MGLKYNCRDVLNKLCRVMTCLHSRVLDKGSGVEQFCRVSSIVFQLNFTFQKNSSRAII